jgi:hypothetical protein
MSNKLRLTTTRKALRRGTTKKLAAAAAGALCVDCDCAGGTECTAVYVNGYCRTNVSDPLVINEAWTYKVEVTHNELPGGGGETGWDEVFGNGDRTYYVDVSWPFFDVHGGVYFAGTKTTRTGAPHVKPTGATAYDHISELQFQLTNGNGADQVLTATHKCGGFFLLGSGSGPSNWTTAVWNSGDLGFCRQVTTIDQFTVADPPVDHNGTAQAGIYKFTACPPCAIDCEGDDCAHVVITGDNRDEILFGTTAQPRSSLEGLYCYSGKELLGPAFVKPAGTAGCVWHWQQKELPTTEHPLRGDIFIWFDGYEYQSILAVREPDAGTGATHRQVFYSKAAIQLECRAGKLVGAMPMAIYEDVIEGPDLNGSECEATITLSNDCGCPDSGADCGDTLHVQFAGQGDDAGDFVMPRVGDNPVWNWESTLVNIECREVGAPYFSPPQTMWVMDMYDRDTLTNHYLFVSKVKCTQCPPDSPGEWTNLVDATHLAGTLLSIVYE